jgi:hypothetical protein
MKILLTIVLTLLLVVAVFLLYARIQPANEGKTPDETRAINVALENIDLSEPTWQTIVVCSSYEVNLPKKVVWETWSRIGEWNTWSPSLVKSARWLGQESWRDGAAFEQTLDLGFPLGTVTVHDTVGTFLEAEVVGWQHRGDHLVYSIIWLFEDLPDGKTMIVNAKIVHGSFVWLLKPIVMNRWQEQIEASVAALAKQASVNHK